MVSMSALRTNIAAVAVWAWVFLHWVAKRSAGLQHFAFNAPHSREFSLNDGICTPANNFLEWDYDNWSCCNTSANCVDPTSRLYNSSVATCAQCFRKAEEASFCEFYEGVENCCKRHRCSDAWTSIIPPHVLSSAKDLCQQSVRCRSTAAKTLQCIFTSLNSETPDEEYCNSLANLPERCFAQGACSSDTIQALLAADRHHLACPAGDSFSTRRATSTLCNATTAACMAGVWKDFAVSTNYSSGFLMPNWSNRTSFNCDLVKRTVRCFLGSGCPMEELYAAAGITAGQLENVLRSCYGCQAKNLFLDFKVTGSRICDTIYFQPLAELDAACLEGVVALSDSRPSHLEPFNYSWSFTEMLRITRARLLSPTEDSRSLRRKWWGGKTKRKRRRRTRIKPYESKSNRLQGFRVSLTAELALSASIRRRVYKTVLLQASDVVAKTSVTGSIVVYKGRSREKAYKIDAYHSCVPDKVGCRLCGPNGYRGLLRRRGPGDTAEQRFMKQTGFGTISPFGFLTAYSFYWDVTCAVEPCTLRSRTGLVFQFNSMQVAVDESPYLVTLRIVKDGRVVHAPPVTINVLNGSSINSNCDIPRVSISSKSLKSGFDKEMNSQVMYVSAGRRRNYLSARLTNSDGERIYHASEQGIKLEWTLNDQLIHVGAYFRLSDELISSGAGMMTFTLFARQDCTTEAKADPFARVVVKANQPPVPGSFTIHPTSGEALKTLFEFAARNWTDLEENLPLHYTFYVGERPVRHQLTTDTLSKTRLSGEGEVSAFVRVRDSMGAKTDSDPFVISLSPAPVSTMSTSIFEEASKEGADEDRLLDLVSGVCHAVNGRTRRVDFRRAAELRKAAFKSLRDVTKRQRSESTYTVSSLARSAHAFKEVLFNTSQLGEDTISDLVVFAKDLVEDTKTQDLTEEEEVISQMFPDLLEGTSQIMAALIPAGVRRRLDNTESICADIKSLRDVVRGVGLLATKDDEPGVFVRSVRATSIQLVASTAAADEIGSLTFGNVGVSIPVDIGAGSRTITTIMTKFDFNIRNCEESSVDLLDVVKVQDECIEALNGTTAAMAPIKPPDSVVSVEFRDPLDNGGGLAIEPANLENPIVLQLPLGNLENDNNGICSAYTSIACGFYNESAGGFRTDGCNVTAVDVVSGTVECSCNHASDYAAWVAFEEDVVDVFTKPISALSVLGVILSSSLMISVFATYLMCLAWGNRRDTRSAKALRREAVGIIVLNRFLMKQRQRQFFVNLKYAVAKGKGADCIEPKLEKPKKVKNFCSRAIAALRYEHSLWGLVRYDPHYTRIQRVSLAIGVVMGNLFVSALFFELKDSEIDELSPSFIILVVLASSLAVALPIRFVTKMLFRLSDYRLGGHADRVAQLYRISLTSEKDFTLIMQNPVDMRLVLAFKDIAIAKAQFKSLKVSSSSSSRCTCLPCCSPYPSTEELEQNILEADEPAGEVISNDEVVQAKTALRDAKQRLKKATIAAKAEWKSRPSMEALRRVELVNKQKSTLLKMAALVGEDASPSAKSRKALCPSWFVYIAWATLIAMYTLSAFYVVRFILTRADVASKPKVRRTEEQLIEAWLISATLGIVTGYCIAEPTMAIIRYALLPYLTLKCGAADPDPDPDAVESQELDMSEAIEATTLPQEIDMQSSKESSGAANKAKPLNRNGQHALEYLSDLIETVF